jgi:WD40 repeat protein
MYMAPEQAAGRRGLTTAVDVYGLGAILYELLTGKPPFEGDSFAEILTKVREREPVPPSRLQRHVARDLETICLNCLHKEPKKRYHASAAELAEDLASFQRREPIKGRRTSVRERLVMWARRKPAVAALSALVLLVFLAGAVAVVWQWRKTDAAWREAQANLYVSRLALAERDLSAGLLDRAEDFLGPCPEDLRHWEWHYLKRWSRGEVTALSGHEREVKAVAYSPGGGVLASAGADGTIRLWEPGRAGDAVVLVRLARPVTGLAFSADGTLLSAASEDRTVRVWGVAKRTTTRLLCELTEAGTVAALSPDGRRLAVAGPGDEPVTVWDWKSKRSLQTLTHGAQVVSLAFSADGRDLASGGWGKEPVKVWDLATGKERRDIFAHVPQVSVTAVAFSPDGRWLAVGYGSSIGLWSLEQRGGEHRLHGGQRGRCTSLAFGSAGRHLAATFATGIVTVWDVGAGQARVAFSARRHSHVLVSVSLSPEGEEPCLAWARGKEVVIERWQTPAGRRSLGAPGPEVRGLAFSPAARRLAVGGGDGAVRLWDVTGSRLLRTLQSHSGAVGCVAFDTAGQRLASAGADGTVKVWDAETGAELRTLQGHTKAVSAVAFEPSGGQWLASASDDGTVFVWDLATGERVFTLPTQKDQVRTLAFNPRGDRLAVGSELGTLKVWDLGSQIEILSHGGHENTVWSVVFSKDGSRLASASWDGTVRLWDARTGKQLGDPFRGHSGSVVSVSFHPDGRRLASAGADGTVKVWDTATGQELLTLKGHPAEATAVAFSADGDLLASASRDGSVLVWDGTPEPEPAR